MGKRILFLMILPVLVIALAGVSYGWQGRMGGMGDPFGLVADESDYLIHPAKIANGEGVRFYGDYRFTYTGVTKWSDRTNETGGLVNFSSLANVSGQELGNNVSVGAAFPVWLGRMGLFFTYAGMRGSYEGDRSGSLGIIPERLELKNNMDDFVLRLLYGLPVGGGFKLGAEAQLAYRHEQQELDDFATGGFTVLNDFMVPYPFPNKSSYLKALFKGSMDGKIGPLDLEFTLRGGLDLPGTNSTDWDFEVISSGTPVSGGRAGGEVRGWQVGGDLWLRYPLAADLTLPVLVRVDYQQKTRSGSGPAFDSGLGSGGAEFRDVAKNLAITAGGGVDKEFGKATRIAAGIYYNYLRGEDEFSEILNFPTDLMTGNTTYPDAVEHQVLLRLAGEHTLSPTVALRAGLSLFYGWVLPAAKSAFSDSTFGTNFYDESPDHGYDWGIGASLGATVKVKPLTLEPFVGGGYRQLHLKMSGAGADFLGEAIFRSDVIARNEWLVDAGLSILFDL